MPYILPTQTLHGYIFELSVLLDMTEKVDCNLNEHNTLNEM